MYSGFVYQLSNKPINCREAASRHQETTSRSQKRMPSSKQLRAELSSCAEEELHPAAASDISENNPDPLYMGVRPGGGVRRTSNKTVRSGKISKGAGLRKNSNKEIGYGSITPESHSVQCTVLPPYSICLRGIVIRSIRLNKEKWTAYKFTKNVYGY